MKRILSFIYQFVDSYRNSNESFHSAAVIFSNPKSLSESEFEDMLWSQAELRLLSWIEKNIPTTNG